MIPVTDYNTNHAQRVDCCRGSLFSSCVFVESSMDRRLPSLLSPHSIEDTFEVPMFFNISMKS